MPLSDEKSICYRAIINYVPQRMVEGHGVWCVCVCVSSRNRTPTQLVRQLAKETNSSPHHQDRPASPIPATPKAANTHTETHSHLLYINLQRRSLDTNFTKHTLKGGHFRFQINMENSPNRIMYVQKYRRRISTDVIVQQL